MSADIEIEIRTRIPASHMILFEVVLEGRNKLDAVDHVRLILRELFVVLPLFCVIVEPLSMAAHQCRLLCLMGFVELNCLSSLFVLWQIVGGFKGMMDDMLRHAPSFRVISSTSSPPNQLENNPLLYCSAFQCSRVT